MERLVLVAVIALVVLLAIWTFNRLVRLRQRVQEAWSQIDVQLKRRHDLIPNLVNAVRGYMAFEQETLRAVTEARAAAVSAGAQGPAAAAAAENLLTSTLRSLFAVVENYPQLKASENVAALQEELTTTENRISFARQHYNASSRDYNTAIATFPTVLVTRQLGFTAREYFEAEPEAAAVPAVQLR